MSGRWPLGVPRARARRHRGLVAAGLAPVFVAVVSVGPAPMSAAQDEPQPSASQPPVSDPVPAADSVDPAVPVATDGPTTTLAVVAPPGTSSGDAPLTESEKASRSIDYVIAGLIGLAVLIVIVSIVFWRRTRPSRILAAEAARTASARPSVLTSEVPGSDAKSTVAPMAGSAVTPDPAVIPDSAATVAAAAAPVRSGFSTTPSMPAGSEAAAEDLVAASPAPEGSWGETVAALGLSSATTADEGPTGVEPGADRGGMWASQGWGTNSPSPTRPDPSTPASTAPAPESEPLPESLEGSDSALPAGFFGRTDDLAEQDPQEGDGDAENGAPNPFLPRR